MPTRDVQSLLDAHPDRSPIPTDDGWLFVFRGEADSVELVLMEDRFPRPGPMQRVEDVRFVEVAAPSDAMVEYKFGVTRSGHRRQVVDHANPERVRDPFGTNSVALGPEYRRPSWLDVDAREGAVVALEVESVAWGRPRSHLLLHPRDHDPTVERPLLVLHDGPEYLDYAHLARCLAVLTDDGAIPEPLVLLHRPFRRTTEYPNNARHVAHVVDELLPAVRRSHAVGRVVVGGVSLGAVAAMTIAHRRPGEVQGLVLQSGSFVRSLGGPFGRGPVLAPAAALTTEVLATRWPLPERIVMSCGTFDGLVEDHREVVPVLAERTDLTYAEINAGHHWTCWRDRLAADLVAALGARA